MTVPFASKHRSTSDAFRVQGVSKMVEHKQLAKQNPSQVARNPMVVLHSCKPNADAEADADADTDAVMA